MPRSASGTGHLPAGMGTAVALVVYSVVTNRREQRPGRYVSRNVVTGSLLVAAARRRGLSWDDLGLAPARAPHGVAVGLVSASLVSTAAVAVTAVATRYRLGRRLLADRRVAVSARDALWQAAVRIPIGTAAFEEVAFRGVLFGLVANRHGRRAGLITSSAAFGFWHVGPTLAALRINHVATGRVGACTSAVALTSAAGLVFGALRIASGHVTTPWLAHWAVNATTLLAAAARQR